MTKNEILKRVEHKIIVSCQALEDEPLFGHEIMARMAEAAFFGGASGIRANYAQDIKAIRQKISLPIIGLIKIHYEDSEAYITPTLKEVKEVVEAGADIIAIDATEALKPGEITTADFIKSIKEQYSNLILADISTYEEGIEAQKAGADIVSTTLSGYTPNSLKSEEPDYLLIERLSRDLNIPVIAEGRIWTPDQALKALQLGAFSVVVGTAITRPQLITRRFVEYINRYDTF